MTFFSWLKRSDPDRAAAGRVYDAIVAAARQPEYYADLGVPDTIDGRFDLIVLHAMLVMRRLRTEGEAGARLAQTVFDHMFRDMDRSLREIGIGDMSIGKHVKRMARAFYGRAARYEQGLDGADELLRDALAANLYRAGAAPETVLDEMVARVRAIDLALRQNSLSDITAGRIRWTSTSAGGP